MIMRGENPCGRLYLLKIKSPTAIFLKKGDKMTCLTFVLKKLNKEERIFLFKNLLNNKKVNKQDLKENDEVVFAEKNHVGLAKLISLYEIKTKEFSDGKEFSRLLNLYNDEITVRLRKGKKEENA